MTATDRKQIADGRFVKLSEADDSAIPYSIANKATQASWPRLTSTVNHNNFPKSVPNKKTSTMEQNQTEILHLPVVSLTIHPVLKNMPEWEDDDLQLIAFCQDIHNRGIQEPLLVTPKNQVADGRHRLRAAKRLKLETVPCRRIPESNVAAVVVQSIVHRRHYSKGALAYLVADFVTHNDRTKSFDLIAQESGISPSTLKQARQLMDIFSTNGQPGEEYRQEIVPKILAGDCALGAAIAGWSGRQSTLGQPKAAITALEMWNRSWTDLGKRFVHWDKFDNDAKAAASAKLATVIEAMPRDLLFLTMKRLSAEAKRREKDQTE